ncbi:tetratricopeptide repeat protein [Enhygromyxa salina]|uniref:tetratricopeptide repeat protein n=1 Tax=Enhygromyxa salina TaxID=215803 RepID=UPI000D08EDF8|nr:tetratricopeptide repeat protein [Enhygromyxa salina]
MPSSNDGSPLHHARNGPEAGAPVRVPKRRPSARPEAGEPLSYRARLLGLLGLIALVHAPLLRYGLIYDDGWTLRSNGFLRRGQFELGVLLSPEAAARHIPDATRPTLVAFDALSLRVLGLEPWAHHGLSIALHLGVCGLLARLLRALGVAEGPRLASVACFGLLAIHAEAIAVVSFREDLLAAALGLAAMIVAVRAIEAARLGAALAWGGAALGLEALACGAKLSAAPLPAILLALAWLRPGQGCARLARDRGRLALVVGLLGVGVALALAQTWIVHGGSPYGGDNPRILAHRIGLGPVLAASTKIHVGYLQQILIPLGLSPEYVDRGAGWLEPETVLASATLVGLVLAAIAVRRRAPLASFAVLAWLLACVPTSNLVGLPNMRADRFMYLPSVPLCVALAIALLALGRRLADYLPKPAESELAGPDLSAGLPLAVFVLMQGSFGLAEARVYVSNTTLWHEAARRAPESARAHALLGLERVGEVRRGDQLAPKVEAAAEDACRRAQRLDPVYELPQLCLGSLAIVRKDWVAAYEHHARAVELSVDRNDRPIAALAQLSLDLPSEWFDAHPELGDRRSLSIAWLERGLSAYPYSPELHAAAGRVYHRLGQPERALELYRRARSLRPDRWETVAAGVELALDLGDAAAAHRTWWSEAKVLGRADPATRSRLSRRLAVARTDPHFSLLHSLLDPGVFPYEP